MRNTGRIHGSKHRRSDSWSKHTKETHRWYRKPRHRWMRQLQLIQNTADSHHQDQLLLVYKSWMVLGQNISLTGCSGRPRSLRSSGTTETTMEGPSVLHSLDVRVQNGNIWAKSGTADFLQEVSTTLVTQVDPVFSSFNQGSVCHWTLLTWDCLLIILHCTEPMP